MPNWSNLTIEQLQAATKAQIISAITTWLENHTKRQIIEKLLDVLEIDDKPTITYRPDGQIAQRDEARRDVLGTVVGGRRTKFSYYEPRGEIDTITIIDAAADLTTVLRRQTIKHYLDIRQPTIIDSQE